MPAENPLGAWARSSIDGFTLYRIPAVDDMAAAGAAPTAAAGSVSSPILLLNGCALSAGGWMPVIDGLRAHGLTRDRDILAIDRPGFATTAWDGLLPELASEVATMQRALTSSGRVRRGVLVAHSMASFRAEALARLRPELVAGIVLVDPSVETYSDRGFAGRFFSAAGLQRLSRALAPWQIREFSASVLHQGFLRQIGPGRELDRDVFKDPYAVPETLKSAFAEWLSYRSQAAALTSLRSAAQPVQAPTTVIFADEVPNASQMETLTRSFAAPVIREVNDSGHLVMIDRPDEIIRAVADQVFRAGSQ